MRCLLTTCFLLLAASASATFQTLDLRYPESAFCIQKEAKWQQVFPTIGSVEPEFSNAWKSETEKVPTIGKNEPDFSNGWKPQAAARPFVNSRAFRGQYAFALDAQGRVTSITNAIDKVTSFTFDNSGNLATRLNAENELTEYGYNDLNRLVAITNEGVEVATFDHDDNGNVLWSANTNATVTFGYDEINRLTASTQSVASASFEVQASYDLNGNRTDLVYPGGLAVTYHYGDDNRLEFITSSHTNLTGGFSFFYDGASRMTNMVYPNGVNSFFGYNAENRMTSIKHGSFVDRVIESNALGFKQTELINAGIKPSPQKTQRSTKTYNDADQLVSESVQTAVTNWTTIDYTYTDNGGLDTVMPANEASTSYTYDYDNRLKSVDDASSFVEYIYDASGARIGRIAGGSPATTNYFVIDYTDGLIRPLAETDASGTVTRYYVWSGSQLLCHIEADGTTRYYHADELGSTLALTDGTGAVTDEFAYMPYGYARHVSHAGSSDTPFQWLGGYGVYYDSDTDLHLTLHRAYSSKLKRFLQPDPLGIDGGVNVYAMANMNPLFFVDPYGLCAETGGSSGGMWDRFMGAVDSVGWKLESWADDNRAQTAANYAQDAASYQDYMTNPEYATIREYSQATRSVVDKVTTALGVYGAYKAVTMPAASSRVGYHATDPANVSSIRANGLRASEGGRLGGGGPYVNSTSRGAIAEFSYRNPTAPPPTVLRVKYDAGLNYRVNPPPSSYSQGSLPFAADTLTTGSLRAPGTFNTIIRNQSSVVLP